MIEVSWIVGWIVDRIVESTGILTVVIEVIHPTYKTKEDHPLNFEEVEEEVAGVGERSMTIEVQVPKGGSDGMTEICTYKDRETEDIHQVTNI